MRRNLVLLGLIISSLFSFGQSQMKYSGFFDSYYKTGPLKYFIEPGNTMMKGDLGRGNISAGAGIGVNYRILPPVYINTSLRYMSLTSKDHEAVRNLAHTGSAFQLNVIGNYHFVYDLIRTNVDRRRGEKFLNAYVSLGLSFMLSNKVSPNQTGFIIDTYANNDTVNITQITSKFSRIVQFPIGIGMPIRVTPRFTLTPEIMWYFSLSDKIDGIEYTKTNNNDSYAFINLKLMFNPKGKRRHPKKMHATNGGTSGGSGSESDFSDDEGDFDNFSDDEDEPNYSEPTQNIEENNEEESSDEEIIENEDDGFPTEDTPSEDEGPKYDEDGFLIDE